jgi:hypothetical protein
MRNWRTVLYVLSGVVAVVLISAFGATSAGTKTYDASLMASWMQAIGSIGAILGAYWIGEKQMRVAEAKAERDKADRKRAYFAIAEVALVEARAIETFVNTPRINALLMIFETSQRRAGIAAEALSGIPLHELGSAQAIAAISAMRAQMHDLQRVFENSVKDIAVTPAETLYPNPDGESIERRAAIETIETIVGSIMSAFARLRRELQIDV